MSNISIFGPRHKKIIYIILFVTLGVFLGYTSVYTEKFLLFFMIGIIFLLIFFKINGGLYEKSYKMMIFFVSMFYVGAIDIGLIIRLSYIFLLLSLFFGLYHGDLKKVRSKTFLYLLFFVFYSLLVTTISVFGNINSEIVLTSLVGIRGSFLRPFLQCFQLLLMVSVYYLILNYCNSWERFEKTINMIYIATIVVVIYGFYEFITYVSDIPLININNPIYAITPNVAYREAAVNFGDFIFKRISSTFPEPGGFALYLQFAFSMILVRAFLRDENLLKKSNLLPLIMVSVAFILAFSRAGFASVGLAIMLLIFYTKKLRLLLLIFVLITSAALFIFILLNYLYGISIEDFIEFVWKYFEMTITFRGKEFSFFPSYYSSLGNVIFGVGLGSEIFYDIPLGNHYTLMLIQLGIAGLLLYFIFAGKIITDLLRINIVYKKDRRIYNITLVLLFAIVMDAIHRVSFISLTQDILLWVVFAICTTFTVLTKKSINEIIDKNGERNQ